MTDKLLSRLLPTTKPELAEKLTKEQFVRALPKEVKAKATTEMVDHINSLMSDPAMRENYRDNLLSYTSVMKDGKFKIQNYIDAVRYVSHKLLGASNIEAYAKTFPDRYQRLVKENVSLDEQATNKVISSYCAAYNKNILVNKIMEQTLVPMHVLNADMYQKAINTQAALMTTANSEKVRCDAANSILTHLKQPEASKIELDITVKQDKTIDDLRATTKELVEAQKKLLGEGGLTAKDIAHSSLNLSKEEDAIDGEFTDKDE